jgi:excisionase family DNA binding protein
LHQLRAAGLITATWAGRAHHYQAALPRDAYLAGLVAAILDQAADPPPCCAPPCIPHPAARDRRSPPHVSGQPPDLMTPAEVAALFRVDPKTVTRWAKQGKLRPVRTLGGHRRYPADIRALLNGSQQ